MAATNQPDLLPSGAGLAASVAVETHGELGELEEIKARGYWEQVWLRFRPGHCDVDEPQLRGLGGDQHAACHYPLERWPLSGDEIRRADERAVATG